MRSTSPGAENIFARVSEDTDTGGVPRAGGPPSGNWSAKFGRFIQTYHGFLSSFVIGVAGLVATSIWQYRQSKTAGEQARSEQAIARTKADNDWRIARAEILSKNLNVLATQGPGSADQRFDTCSRPATLFADQTPVEYQQHHRNAERDESDDDQRGFHS